MVFETITMSMVLAINIGLVEVIKKLITNTRYIPLTAIGIGILLMFILRLVPNSEMIIYSMTYSEAILYGFMLGLMSIGIYSGSTNTFKKSDEIEK